jgi:hypothetical protein
MISRTRRRLLSGMLLLLLPQALLLHTRSCNGNANPESSGDRCQASNAAVAVAGACSECFASYGQRNRLLCHQLSPQVTQAPTARVW